MDADPHAQALSDLLRQNGFFESLPPAATPLVSHLFQEYASLRASLSALRAELLELRETATFQQKLLQPIQADNRKLLEENNFLTLRIAELEDNSTYQQGIPFQFPGRQKTEIDAESKAMEEELTKLRSYCKEMVAKNNLIGEENQKLKNELEWGMKNNEKVVQQFEIEKKRKGNGNNLSGSVGKSQSVQQAVHQVITDAVPVSESISRSSVDSIYSVHTHEIQLQTEEQACFQCAIYMQQISDLKLSLNSKTSVLRNEKSNVLNSVQSQLFAANQQLLEKQNLIDQLVKKVNSFEIGENDQKQQELQRDQQLAELQATITVQTALNTQLEKQILLLQQEKLSKVQDLQDQQVLYNNIQNSQQSDKLENLKLQKTAQKLSRVIEEMRARRKLDEGVICRLDKANSTMSQFLSRLSLENQRLKRKFGVEEFGADEVMDGVE